MLTENYSNNISHHFLTVIAAFGDNEKNIDLKHFYCPQILRTTYNNKLALYTARLYFQIERR